MRAHGDASHRERASYERYLADLRSMAHRARGSSPEADGRKPGRCELVESNLFYVVRFAREYSMFGIPFEDLLSEGNVGLLEAAERFDHERGTKFITYASWWIRKRMLNLVARQLTFIRVPKYKLERLRRVRAAEATLVARLCRQPLIEELATETGLPQREIESLRLIGQRQVSLEHIVDEDSGRKLEECLSEGPGPEAEEGLIEQDYEGHLARLVASLPEKERLVVLRRFGFEGRQPATLQSIAQQLGLSRERVRQIEMQALQRIRRTLAIRPRTLSGPPATARTGTA